MATTTTNFGWDIPQSTDLVKDGATAIAALGQDIDTAFVDLKGGTTGQILAKASATDLDYSWITNDVGDITAVTAGTGISGGGTSGAVTITNSMATEIAAKGDLIVGTGSATFDNLTAGTNGQVPVADSTASTGLKYSNNAPLGGMSILNSGGTNLTGAATITLSGLSNLSRISILMNGASSVNAGSTVSLRFNSDATNNYGYAGNFQSSGTLTNAYNQNATSIPVAKQGSSASNVVSALINIESCFSDGMNQYTLGSSADGTSTETFNWVGFYNGTKISSISFISSSGNFDGGIFYVFGA
jgi:hypothetical protein